MFRKMRRKKQELTAGQAAEVLRRNTSGVLALAGDDGYPYAVPLSYTLREETAADGSLVLKVYFHGAASGHKLDAIAREPKASFCVIDQDTVVPEEYTTRYRSVIAFGRVRILEEETEKRNAALWLGDRYCPGQREGVCAEIERSFAHLCMLELKVEHFSGKQSRELASGQPV